MHHGISRRTLIAAVLMLASAIGGVAAFSLLDGDSELAQGSEPQVLLLTEGDLKDFARFEPIASASRVDSLDQARAVTRQAPAVVVIDSAFAANLKSGDLRSLVGGGSAVIGLNIPLGQLNDLTGFEEELEPKVRRPAPAGEAGCLGALLQPGMADANGL
jgi:hypothetical protein